ncbi:CCDC90 family protein [Escherichia coli]|uniref:CCDC90 family protein n=1 Tax=Escherichia coli TaxID=562 RepID=UPI0021E8C713|nr:CCDC90 family protein [Escherichia coli]MCV2999808.1 CCDC90 family protein [Escherichia coli]
MGNVARNLFGNSAGSMSHSERDVLYHGGDGGSSGGGMSDKLERRIERLESDLSLTRNDLATLAERTTNLSTKADVGEVKGELKADIAHLKGELKSDTANLKEQLKSDINSLKGELTEAMDKRFDKIMDEMNRRFDKVDDNTKWRWSGIIVPVCTTIFTAAVAYFVAKFVG